MRHALGVALLCFATPVAAQSVEVAGGDWSDIPVVHAAGTKTMGEPALQRIEHLLGPEGPCSTGQRNSVEVRVPFLLHFGQSGSVERIVVKNTGCKQLESLIGSVVLGMAQSGEFRPTGENDANWYRGEINYLIR